MIVYIAGPYRGVSHDRHSYEAIAKNIATATAAAAWCANHGIGYFCPHMNSAHMELLAPDVDPSFWLEMDLMFLEHCDAVLLLPNWRASKGTVAEVQAAREKGLPIFKSREALSSAKIPTKEIV